MGKVLKLFNTLQLDHFYQLENAVREAMLRDKQGNALVVVECLYALKFTPDTWLTFEEIYTLLSQRFGCSRRLVYEGLKAKRVFQRRKKLAKAHQRGARPYLYHIPYPLQLKAEFAPESDPTPSDQLVKADLQSVSAYRKGLHREFIRRLWEENGYQGVKIYRALLAYRLGVSPRTVRTYDYLLGFSHEANYIEKRIYWKDWNKLPKFKNSYDAQGKKLASRTWLKIVDWETGYTQIKPYVAYLAYEGLKANYAVYEVSRDANTYYPYKRPVRGKDGVIDAIDFYYAEIEAIQTAGFHRQDNDWVLQRE